MKFIEGHDRTQTHLFPLSLDASIDPDNEIRLIDLFIDSLRVEDYGFEMDFIENGRPAYHPACLLKLFIYGYLNKTRSSRDLEKECNRNIEVMWLMRSLCPDHNTISNFRKDNQKAIRKVFRATVQLAKTFDLIGGKLVAGDSTKLRAQNSKKNNFNPKKIKRHLAYIEGKLEQYNRVLSQADGDHKHAKKQLKTHLERKRNYESLTAQLEKSGDTQVSTSDPESRHMITRNNITEVAYCIQTTVDAKHNIPIDFVVTNQNDSKAMGRMVRRAKIILQTPDFTALYDKGYHTGSEFAAAHKQGVEVLVAVPNVGSHAPDSTFDVENFKYNQQTDLYTCPANQKLVSNGKWYTKKTGSNNTKIKHYKTKQCKSCDFQERCTRNKVGRILERSEHAHLIKQNKDRVNANKELYRKRQAIVEHPYGVIKRQWGFNYIMTKRSMNRASSDVGLIFAAYNLRRIFNLIDKNQLKEFLKELAYIFQTKWTLFKPFKHLYSIHSWLSNVSRINFGFHRSTIFDVSPVRL